MKKLLNFDDFLNESILNEGKFTDVWVDLPYGDWKSEYEIPAKVQKELYSELQQKLGSKTVKVKEDIKDVSKSPIFQEFITLAEWDAFWTWTNKYESTTIAAHELKNGEIVVGVYQTYSKNNPDTTIIWTITK